MIIYPICIHVSIPWLELNVFKDLKMPRWYTQVGEIWNHRAILDGSDHILSLVWIFSLFNISPRAPIYITHLNIWDNAVYVAIGIYGLLYKAYRSTFKLYYRLGVPKPIAICLCPLCRFGLKILDRLMCNFFLSITCTYTRESGSKSWGRG